MASIIKYHYFVEGECEKKLIEILKEQKGLIISGKVDVFNAVQKRFTQLHLRSFYKNTIVILIFDTDTNDAAILKENIAFLKKGNNVKDVWCIPQCCNLEDELVKATKLKNVSDLVGAASAKDFKHDFLREKNLFSKLCSWEFDLSKMWTGHPTGTFSGIVNSGSKIICR